jgi:branched-subunit amino acid transport protein
MVWMSKSYIFIILGMMAATYIPRLVPFFLVSKSSNSGWVSRFLKFIPYTALGALIVPGVVEAIPEMPFAGIAGIIFALLFSWFRRSVIISVLGAVIVSYGVIQLAL